VIPDEPALPPEVAARIAEHVPRVVDADWPKLTQAQKDILRVLLPLETPVAAAHTERLGEAS
jgi:hypothetical protein